MGGNIDPFPFRDAAMLSIPLAIGTISLSACGLALAAAASQAGETPWSTYPTGSVLAVTTATGRIVRGHLDPRTTREHLWLVANAEGMTVGSRLSVADVVQIDAADPVLLPPREPGAAEEGDRVSSIEGGRRTSARQPSIRRPPVKSLAVFAQLENWDDDPQPDGLRLYIVPRGPRGEMVPTTGALSIQLAVYRGDWRHSRGRYRDEEQWSREISADEFGPHGAVVDLPFAQVSPETDRELHSLGVLRVRMSVAGEGAFDATLHNVELRSRPPHPAR